MRKLLILVTMICPPIAHIFAQNVQNAGRCRSTEVLQQSLVQNPSLTAKLEAIESHNTEYASQTLNARSAGVTIPVVVHVVYRTNTENISTAQIESQIAVLNADYNKENTDAVLVPSIFKNVAASCGISFQLANVDTNGKPTSGIDRVQTNMATWQTDDAVKNNAQGGVAPWDPTSYLNIWVCNMDGGVLGYSTFPGMPLATDGVVIDYRCFGTKGTASAPYNLGRTATHEIGHWLNLKHVWGDADCGDDHISDTPTQAHSNEGDPSFPHYSTCGGITTSDMFMNFMDYVNDDAMHLFTQGQKARMLALFSTGGARTGIAVSKGWNPTVAGRIATAIAPSPTEPKTTGSLAVYPNPAIDEVTIEWSLGGETNTTLTIFNLEGKIVERQTNASMGGNGKANIETVGYPNGVYIVSILAGDAIVNKKMVVGHIY